MKRAAKPRPLAPVAQRLSGVADGMTHADSTFGPTLANHETRIAALETCHNDLQETVRLLNLRIVEDHRRLHRLDQLVAAILSAVSTWDREGR